jgi:hypothetical protein
MKLGTGRICAIVGVFCETRLATLPAAVVSVLGERTEK